MRTIIAAAALLALAVSPSLAEDAPAAPANSSAPAITVSTIAPRPLVDSVRVSGLIGPVDRVLVQPLIEGQPIDSVEAEVGDWVEAGQTLARLSDAALRLQRSQLDATRASAEATIAQSQAQILEAQAVLDQARRDRDRAVQLAKQGATSSAAADTALSQAQTAEARLTASRQGLVAAEAQLRLVDAQIADVELQLQRTAVVAPVSGEVVERDAMIGAIASMAGSPLFALVRDGELELRADVAEQDLLRLAVGQPAEVRLVGRKEPIEGVVRLVEPTVDATTRLGAVRIAIKDPSKVRSGMFAEAVVTAAEREALAAPASSIRDDGAKETVLIVRDGVVAETEIASGIRDGGFVEIVEGLSDGDVVVTKAGAFVRPGDRITPVPAPSEPVLN